MNGLSIRLAILVVTGIAVNGASAQSTMRCGSKLIEAGMTRAEVQNYCGEPDAKEVEEQDVRAGNRVVGKTEVQRWTYRQTGSIVRVLEFDQDKLVAIRLDP